MAADGSGERSIGTSTFESESLPSVGETKPRVAWLGTKSVIVFDRLVSPEVLDFARAGAERIFAGKRRSQYFMPQAEINELRSTS
jgi:hypothetical protein